MDDWIKRALTRRVRNREIPPDQRLVIGVKFAIAMTIILSALEVAHLAFLGLLEQRNLRRHHRLNGHHKRHTHSTENLEGEAPIG